MEIQIDEEFKSLLFPLSPDEYNQLKENILKDGCLDPLIVWGNILVDGHNRYEICTENQIPFTTVSKEFSNRDEVIEFILRTQLGRRNLTDFHRNRIALRYEDILKKKAKERMSEGGGDKRSEAVRNRVTSNDDTRKPKGRNNTNAELGRIAGTSETSIHRTKTILEKGTPEQIERAEKGGKGNSISTIVREIKEKDKKELEKEPEKEPDRLQYFVEAFLENSNDFLKILENIEDDYREVMQTKHKKGFSKIIKDIKDLQEVLR